MKVHVKYRDGYRNQLAETISMQLPIQLWPDLVIDTEFYRIDAGGRLTIRHGYAWDGASGPTIDWPASQIIVPSLIHDVLCQAGRSGHLYSIANAREHTDRLFYELLRERGMNFIRAYIWYRGVRIGSLMASHDKEVKESS